MPRPRQWSATATATSAVEDRCCRIYRAIPTTAPPGVTAVRASWSRWSTWASRERVRSSSSATPPRKRACRVSGPSPSNHEAIAATSPVASGRTTMAEPSRRITRSSSDPAAPAGPAIVATAGSISVIIAHPLVLRGASAAFTVAPGPPPPRAIRPGP